MKQIYVDLEVSTCVILPLTIHFLHRRDKQRDDHKKTNVKFRSVADV